ncbi:MAG: hypothetical protein K6B70_01560 [Clostridia bacterium]|nr:hypothetical protein [Clostridia bacterium]
MELNLRDIDLFISKILEDYDKTYNLAIHVILLECIKEVGLNKNKIIENLDAYMSDDVLEKISNSSFINKTYLKNFVALDNNSRKGLLNKLVEILNKCDEKDGLLVIPEQPKLIEKIKPAPEPRNIIEINDFELGIIKIDCDNGSVDGDSIKYEHKATYKDFPVDFSVDYEIYGIDDEMADVKENIENDKKLYVNDIRYLKGKMDIIEKFVIEKIWKWFNEGDKEQEIKEKYIKLAISLSVELANESYNRGNSILMTAGWSFEEENNEEEGYFDFEINKDTDELIGYELNYY